MSDVTKMNDKGPNPDFQQNPTIHDLVVKLNEVIDQVNANTAAIAALE